jgi:hypothetical protein
MGNLKRNKKLYIVVSEGGSNTPLSFDGNMSMFLIDFHTRKNPLPLYAKKVAKKLIRIDEITRASNGEEIKGYILFPVRLPFAYMHRPLSEKESKEKTSANIAANAAKLDWYSDNLGALTNNTPIQKENIIISHDKLVL